MDRGARSAPGDWQMARQLALENTMPFQGLPELVAYHEGLFAAEGLEITWVDRTRSAPRRTDRGITDPNAISSLLSHGSELIDRKSTRLNSSHTVISYAVF